jgi:hypothetical protein
LSRSPDIPGKQAMDNFSGETKPPERFLIPAAGQAAI